MTTTTSVLSPFPKLRFVDANGNALSGGKLFTYIAGTTTKQNTFTDSTGGTPNANPVLLDTRGEAAVFINPAQAYKYVLSPSTDTDPPTNAIWTIDQVNGGPIDASMVPVVGANGLAAARTAFGLGSIATQSAASVAITGGTISGTTISGTLQQAINTITNTRQAKTTAYTVVNGDKGSSIALGGSAFYTLTLNAASGYDANFIISVVNEDTGRAKRISPNGITSFLLWPLQTCIILNSNNTWFTFGAPAPWILTGNLSVYVDSTNGNNSNDGLATGSGNALLTIQEAENRMKKNFNFNGFSGTVFLALGTYSENVVIATQPIGAHVYTIQGDPTSAATAAGYIINGGGGAGSDTIFVTDLGEVTLNGVTVKNTGANGVHVSQGGICDIKGNTNLDAATVQVLVSQLGRVNYSGPHSLTANATNMTQVNGGSVSWGSSITVSIPNALTYTTFLAMTNGFADCSGAAVTFSGAGAAGTTGKLYTVAMNGALVLSGTTLPGNVAGTTSTGGQVSA